MHNTLKQLLLQSVLWWWSKSQRVFSKLVVGYPEKYIWRWQGVMTSSSTGLTTSCSPARWLCRSVSAFSSPGPGENSKIPRNIYWEATTWIPLLWEWASLRHFSTPFFSWVSYSNWRDVTAQHCFCLKGKHSSLAWRHWIMFHLRSYIKSAPWCFWNQNL